MKKLLFGLTMLASLSTFATVDLTHNPSECPSEVNRYYKSDQEGALLLHLGQNNRNEITFQYKWDNGDALTKAIIVDGSKMYRGESEVSYFCKDQMIYVKSKKENSIKVSRFSFERDYVEVKNFYTGDEFRWYSISDEDVENLKKEIKAEKLREAEIAKGHRDGFQYGSNVGFRIGSNAGRSGVELNPDLFELNVNFEGKTSHYVDAFIKAYNKKVKNGHEVGFAIYKAEGPTSNQYRTQRDSVTNNRSQEFEKRFMCRLEFKSQFFSNVSYLLNVERVFATSEYAARKNAKLDMISKCQNLKYADYFDRERTRPYCVSQARQLNFDCFID